jgi:hypothetical protein
MNKNPLAPKPVALKLKTKIKAGGFGLNHNESLSRLRVKSGTKAGGISLNHNETLVAPR